MITTPSTIQVTPATGLLVPPMAAQPLRRALENLNYLYKWHRPPLVDVCPTCATAGGRGTFVYPIAPSADGLRYNFEHRIMPSNNSTCAITVDYTTAYAGGATAWTNIYASNPATTANTLLTQQDNAQTVPANAVALRVDYQAAAGTIAPQHLLVYPAPDAPTAGIKACGFRPFDDGMLTATGAPVHTELVNRCKLSALAVLRDRRQQALTFLQVETGTPWIVCPSDKGTILSGALYEAFNDLPPVRLFLPYQGPDVQLTVAVLADVDAGGTAGLVRVHQVNHPQGEEVTFAADGAINTANLTVHLSGSGTDRYADLAIGAKCTHGNKTRLRAVSAYWRPGD